METNSDHQSRPRKRSWFQRFSDHRWRNLGCAVLLVCLIAGAWFWLRRSPDDSPVLYEFPPFDEVQWRQVLAEEAVRYRESRIRSQSSRVPFRLASAANSSLSNSNTSNSSSSGKRSEFWSFQLLKTPSVPESGDSTWIKNPIDAFVLAKLNEKGLSPAAEADAWTLARRIWLDLKGLPPTPDQVLKFVASNSSGTYEQAVEELLADQAFGEHWASFWLDLARYSDSNGYELDELKPYGFTYRDFVIWSMNEDVAFDEFLRWQIAGDLIAPDNPMAVAATGFFTNAPVNNFRPQESERYDELADQVSTLGRGMLGLSIGCARCHDHFYDPISHKEYHRLVAVLKDTKRETRYLVRDQGQAYLDSGGREYEAAKKEIEQILMESIKDANIEELDFTRAEKDLLKQPIDPDNQEQALLLSKCNRCLEVYVEDIGENTRPRPADRKRYYELKAIIQKHEPHLAPLPPMGLTLSGDFVSEMPILKGGKADQKGKKVGPGFLTELTTGMPRFDKDQWKSWSDSPRVALAEWMTDTEGGAGALVARVIVNRLWQHHFGQGLVSTPSDFGLLGDEPTHPELLEWLAGELVRNDWSLKHIHRLIVNSATYRQSTTPLQESFELDRQNQWLARQNQFRMSAEVVRDSILYCSGNLNEKSYGRPVFVKIPEAAIFATQDDPDYIWPLNTSDEDDRRRKSIYLVKKRTIPIPFLNLFDLPDASFSCEKRSRSVVPTQALTLMNSPLVKENTIHLAEKLAAKFDRSEDVIDQAFLVILGRRPSVAEMELCMESFADDPVQPYSTSSLIDLCHTLFMTNEFIYRN